MYLNFPFSVPPLPHPIDFLLLLLLPFSFVLHNLCSVQKWKISTFRSISLQSTNGDKGFFLISGNHSFTLRFSLRQVPTSFFPPQKLLSHRVFLRTVNWTIFNRSGKPVLLYITEPPRRQEKKLVFRTRSRTYAEREIEVSRHNWKLNRTQLHFGIRCVEYNSRRIPHFLPRIISSNPHHGELLAWIKDW